MGDLLMKTRALGAVLLPVLICGLALLFGAFGWNLPPVDHSQITTPDPGPIPPPELATRSWLLYGHRPIPDSRGLTLRQVLVKRFGASAVPENVEAGIPASPTAEGSLVIERVVPVAMAAQEGQLPTQGALPTGAVWLVLYRNAAGAHGALQIARTEDGGWIQAAEPASMALPLTQDASWTIVPTSTGKYRNRLDWLLVDEGVDVYAVVLRYQWSSGKATLEDRELGIGQRYSPSAMAASVVEQ